MGGGGSGESRVSLGHSVHVVVTIPAARSPRDCYISPLRTGRISRKTYDCDSHSPFRRLGLGVAHTARPGGLRTSPLHTALVHRRWLKSSSKDDHATVPVEITAPPISTVPFEVDPQLALKSKSFGEVARAYSLLYVRPPMSHQATTAAAFIW